MKKLLNLGLILCFIGCGKQYSITHNEYYAPKSDRFKLNKKVQTTDSSVLSTNSLYKKTDGNDFWFKFFPDGKVYFGHLSKIPKSVNEKINGFVGYYNLKDSNLKIELYYVQQWKWNYLILEGTIKNDSILFYSDHYRGRRRNIGHFTNGYSFAKSSEVFVLRKPDW